MESVFRPACRDEFGPRSTVSWILHLLPLLSFFPLANVMLLQMFCYPWNGRPPGFGDVMRILTTFSPIALHCLLYDFFVASDVVSSLCAGVLRCPEKEWWRVPLLCLAFVCQISWHAYSIINWQTVSEIKTETSDTSLMEKCQHCLIYVIKKVNCVSFSGDSSELQRLLAVGGILGEWYVQ